MGSPVRSGELETSSPTEEPNMRITHSLTLLALALALPVMAQTPTAPAPPAAPQEGRFFDRMQRMADKLQLTEAQRASCKAIIMKHRDSLKAKGKAAREARRAFFEAKQKPETTPDVLRSLNRTMADTRIEATIEGRTMRQELRAELTPDQREKAAFMMGRQAGMRRGHGDWGGMGMMDGPGRPMGKCPCPPPPAPAK
jgi:Spy/CpxP family protein refolding chaperone